MASKSPTHVGINSQNIFEKCQFGKMYTKLVTFCEQTAAAAQHSQLDQEERKEDGRFALGHVGFGQIWPQRRGNSFLKPHNSSLGFHLIL